MGGMTVLHFNFAGIDHVKMRKEEEYTGHRKSRWRRARRKQST